MNTKAETLTQLEARGRLFATALLDAGFSASEVRDAAFGPAVRIHGGIQSFNAESETFLGSASDQRNLASEGHTCFAFIAGVVAVIEERA